ncbi:LLM class flavin-dependent oxidoreductase [Lapillicoccus jejuensis]|uniref:Luciferase family oxidoreductase group 1 n=1 Tax=Lapillicoccus jejuensis TaxID=402171 RepID=A0A542DZU0_9MICO|nr:LLM class flavin-dependent oxidoreductase [Lapillicoccus jejuensis]TQJ08612.1 luciferase family oxidoreductase group 1 [Lapillicoccus jejuensis]
MSTRAGLAVLDLVPVAEGRTAAEAVEETVVAARAAEAAGYGRYWMAEHHSFPGVASSATAILVGHVADHTSRIRVGSGGIMLPNHAPLVVAEQFGTLETMHPGRIDLGLGRAPGTDPVTAHALRRVEDAAVDFGSEVRQVIDYLGPVSEHARVRAVPGEGTNVPVWVLGSSHGGAQVAGALGLPYAFASHFAPRMLLSALEVYRSGFRAADPDARPGALAAPRAMAAVNAVVADTREKAQRIWGSHLQRVRGIVTGRRALLPPPTDGDPTAGWSPQEKAAVEQMTAVSFVGTPAEVRAGLDDFVDATGVDEVIVATAAYDVQDRVRSLELLAEAWA